jgi:ribonuclease-3
MQRYSQNILEIEKILNYSFKEKKYLHLAFVHRSFFNENRGLIEGYNERLEFLGDSVLSLIVSEYLFQRFKDEKEGILSFLRSRIVDAPSCALFVKKLKLEKFLLLGRGEDRTKRGRETILADLFEAILGAIYLDGGFLEAKKFLIENFEGDILRILEKPTINYKTELQNYSQKRYQTVPIYRTLVEKGPDHLKTFEVEVLIGNIVYGRGVGSSKKEAEIVAAKSALAKLN